MVLSRDVRTRELKKNPDARYPHQKKKIRVLEVGPQVSVFSKLLGRFQGAPKWRNTGLT